MLTLSPALKSNARLIGATALRSLPAVALMLGAAILGHHDPALASTATIPTDATATQNGVSAALQSVQNNMVMPVVRGVIVLGTTVGTGVMAFNPDKKEALKYCSGAVLCGGLAYTGSYTLDHYVAPSLSGTSGLLIQ